MRLLFGAKVRAATPPRLCEPRHQNTYLIQRSALQHDELREAYLSLQAPSPALFSSEVLGHTAVGRGVHNPLPILLEHLPPQHLREHVGWVLVSWNVAHVDLWVQGSGMCWRVFKCGESGRG